MTNAAIYAAWRGNLTAILPLTRLYENRPAHTTSGSFAPPRGGAANDRTLSDKTAGTARLSMHDPMARRPWMQTARFDDAFFDGMESSIVDVNQACMLPPACYGDPEFFQFELGAIFSREWLCVGREA